MRTGAPESGRDARPPHSNAVSTPGAPVRATARVRPIVPVTLETSLGGRHVSDPYVRRFWVAAIGSDAVAELLRMVRAAEKGEGVRLPRHLPTLLRTGLARATTGSLVVSERVPEVPRELRWRFPPSLVNEHALWVGSAPNGKRRHQNQGDSLSNGEGNSDPDVGASAQD